MPATAPAVRGLGLQRILCVVVVLVMVLATVYAVWISISNFSQIRV